MHCDDVEMLMADALGDELAPDDRPVFEAHLAECERCRRDYETSMAALDAMRGLSGPTCVTMRREGDRLVLERSSRPFSVRLFGGTVRYAAGIVLAFAAGYTMSSVRPMLEGSRAARVETRLVVGEGANPSANDLQRALVKTHIRKPSRSRLATALIAIGSARR